MSRCIVNVVNESGDVVFYDEARNAHEGVVHIWITLGMKYGALEYPSIIGNLKPLWRLVENVNVPVHERVVLASTFDYAMARKSFLPDLIRAYEQFCEEHPTQTIQDIIEIYKRILSCDHAHSVCWQMSSTAKNLWEVEPADDSGMSVLYNINNSDKHWYIEDQKEVFAQATS